MRPEQRSKQHSRNWRKIIIIPTAAGAPFQLSAETVMFLTIGNLQIGGTASYLGSAVLLNGTEQAYGVLNASLSDGDTILLSLYDYLADYSGSISPSYIGDASGAYLDAVSVTAGNSLLFEGYSGSSAIGSGYSLYVTQDPAALGTAMTTSACAFSTTGTYYVIGKDANAGKQCFQLRPCRMQSDGKPGGKRQRRSEP